ncbi:MAG: hypothetical protein ABIH66_06500 [bacterium]
MFKGSKVQGSKEVGGVGELDKKRNKEKRNGEKSNKSHPREAWMRPVLVSTLELLNVEP